MTKKELQNRIERGAELQWTFNEGKKDDFLLVTPIENGLACEPVTLKEALLFRHLEGRIV